MKYVGVQHAPSILNITLTFNTNEHHPYHLWCMFHHMTLYMYVFILFLSHFVVFMVSNVQPSKGFGSSSCAEFSELLY